MGLSFQHLLHHQLGVAQAAGQLLAAAKLLQQGQFVGAEVSFLINVGHRGHEGAEDQLGVVLAQRRDSQKWVLFQANPQP